MACGMHGRANFAWAHMDEDKLQELESAAIPLNDCAATGKDA